MPVDLIRYDLLAQDALRGVVKKVLTDIAARGLPGEHHFFISFHTRADGVKISDRLREKYPDELTFAQTGVALEEQIAVAALFELLKFPQVFA
jgi:hypothetical protein